MLEMQDNTNLPIPAQTPWMYKKLGNSWKLIHGFVIWNRWDGIVGQSDLPKERDMKWYPDHLKDFAMSLPINDKYDSKYLREQVHRDKPNEA